MRPKQPHSWQRALVTFLSLQMALGPLADPAYAQLTQLADEPIGFTTQAEPNIVLTVDDSTSMLSDFLPDYIIGAVPGAVPAVGGFCRDATGRMSSACGFIGQPDRPPHIYYDAGIPFRAYQPGNPPSALPAFTDSTRPDWMRVWPAPVHSNALNRVYYDPAITYRPPLKYDGTPYAEQNAATTVNWTKVVADPWAPSAAMTKYVSVVANVNVGMWCNIDHPANVNNNPATVANWSPAAGGGAECRINGTDYSGVAPAQLGDYQYPWRGSTPSTQYFFRNYNHNANAWNSGNAGNNTSWNKTLWCNAASPKWPRNGTSSCTTTYNCPGGTYQPKMEPQYCRDAGPKTTCSADRSTRPPAATRIRCTAHLAPASAPSACPAPSTIVPTTRTSVGVGRCRWVSNTSVGSNANCDCNTVGCTVNPSHAACTPQTNGGVVGSCSNGVTPVPVTNCTLPSKAGGACNQVLWNEVTNVPTTTTMLQDAQGAGLVCRRNTSANPTQYPSGVFTTRINDGSCPQVTSYAQVPRHYWKTSIEWCSAKIITANDKWLGFGQPGTCQDEHDLTHPYPRFYKYGVRKTDPEYLDNYAFPAFERVDLVNDSRTYTHAYYRNGLLTTINRTAAEELTNYSNWFAYYRTRIQAAKTVISQNFTFLDDTYRVGFHTLSNLPASSFVDVGASMRTPAARRTCGTSSCSPSPSRWASRRRTSTRSSASGSCSRTAAIRRCWARPTRSRCPARRTTTCCSRTASRTSSRCRPSPWPTRTTWCRLFPSRCPPRCRQSRPVHHGLRCTGKTPVHRSPIRWPTTRPTTGSRTCGPP